MFAEVGGAGGVAFGGFQVGLAELLEVRRLGVDEEFVDSGDLQILNQAEIDSHAEAGEEVHGLFGADGLGGAEEAVGA